MPRQRLGVALVVPAPIGTEVDGLRRALGDGALVRIPPHLTLVPPVNVRDEDVPAAIEVLRAAAAATPSLRLRLGPATTFHPVTPVVYLAVGGDVEVLRALRDRVFRAPLERPLTHPFTPHVTVSDDMAPDRIPPAVAALADYTADVVVDRVHLLREEPGRLWRPLADAPFARPATVARGGLPLELTPSEVPPPSAGPLLASIASSPAEHAVGAPFDGAPGAPGGSVGSVGPPLGAPFAVTARRDGAVVGVAAGWVSGPVATLAALVVAPGERRQGIGRHLLAAVDDDARRRGCTTLTTVAPVTAAAEALLASAGWRPGATLPSGTGEDAAWREWRRAL